MNTDIHTLLTNTILQGRNPDTWRVDYIISNVNKLFIRFVQGSRKKRLTADGLCEALTDSPEVMVRRGRCWMPTGNEVERVDVETRNISLSLYFEVDNVIMQMSLRRLYMIDKEYDATYVDSDIFLDRLMQFEEAVSKDIEQWPDVVHDCVKRVKLIRIREAAAKGYLSQQASTIGFTFNVQTTSEGITVRLLAKGERELSTSITERDDVVKKLDFIISEMSRKIGKE